MLTQAQNQILSSRIIVPLLMMQTAIIFPRNNLDSKSLNNSGKSLLSLCRETSLRTVNDRMIGDLLGKFTSIHYNGCSVVNYTLVSDNLLKSVI